MDILLSRIKQKSRPSLSALARLLPLQNPAISYIVERRNWAIKSEGTNIVRELTNLTCNISIKITSKPYLTQSQIIHFGSQFMFQNWLRSVNNRSSVVVTYFHGQKGQGDIIEKNLDYLIQNQHRVAKVIVSFNEMKERLESYGLASELISRIPVGVSTGVFSPSASRMQTRAIRDSLGIPNGYFVIGSFQKDGEGWRNGMSPKRIKGPDILVEAIQKLSIDIPVFVVLSGPARGFVKQKLEQFGIPYKHSRPKEEMEMARLYKALDLYLISSREEGGPKGLVEALSTGCPVVTTPVGMANDINLQSSFFSVSKDFDATELAERSLNVLKQELRDSDLKALRLSVHHCDFKAIAEQHVSKIYRPLLSMPDITAEKE